MTGQSGGIPDADRTRRSAVGPVRMGVEVLDRVPAAAELLQYVALGGTGRLLPGTGGRQVALVGPDRAAGVDEAVRGPDRVAEVGDGGPDAGEELGGGLVPAAGIVLDVARSEVVGVVAVQGADEEVPAVVVGVDGSLAGVGHGGQGDRFPGQGGARDGLVVAAGERERGTGGHGGQGDHDGGRGGRAQQVRLAVRHGTLQSSRRRRMSGIQPNQRTARTPGAVRDTWGAGRDGRRGRDGRVSRDGRGGRAAPRSAPSDGPPGDRR